MNKCFILALAAASNLYLIVMGALGGVVEADYARLDSKKGRLEEQREQFETERIAAEHTGDNARVEELNQDVSNIEQEIEKVSQEIAAAVPKLQLAGRAASGHFEADVTESSVIKAKTIGDWQKAFKQFSSQRGWFTGGGQLFQVGPEDRAGNLVDVIKETPISLLMQDPIAGLDALISIGDLAWDMAQKKQFVAGEESRDYAVVANQLKNKMVEFARQTDFSKETLPDELKKWADFYKKVDALHATPLIKGPVEHEIASKITNVIKKAIGAVPAEPDKAVDTLYEMAMVIADLPVEAQKTLLEPIAAKMSDRVSQALNQDTLMAGTIGKNEHVEEVIEEAYKREISMLEKYMMLMQNSTIPENAKSAQVQAARRLTRLKDFADAQKTTVGSFLQGLWKAAKGWVTPDVLETVLSNGHQEEFIKTEDEQKGRFGLGKLEALPQDIIVRMLGELPSIIQNLDQAQDPAQRRALVEKIDALKSKLTEKVFPPKTPTWDFDPIWTYKEMLIEERDIKGLEENIKQMDEAVERAKAKELSEITELTGTLEETIEKAKTATDNELIALDSSLEAQRKDLEKYSNTILSEAKQKPIVLALGQIEAWQSVADLARQVQGFAQAESGQTLSEAFLSQMTRTISFLDYRQEPLFSDQLSVMQKQRDVLARATKTLTAQTITVEGKPLNLVEIGQLATGAVYMSEKLPGDLASLEKSGLVTSTKTEKGSVVYKITDKMRYLSNAAQEHGSLQERSDQLSAYLSNHTAGTPPEADELRTASGGVIPLAQELRLPFLIPDDQVELLKNVYRLAFDQGFLMPEGDNQEERRRQVAVGFSQDKLVRDIADILNTQRKSGQVVDLYFEAVVIQRLKSFDPTLTQAQREALNNDASRAKMMTDILSLSDPEAVLAMNPDIVAQESTTLYKELSYQYTAALTDLSLGWKDFKLTWKKRGSKVAFYSILPASVAAFFGAKFALGSGASLLGATIGTAVGGPFGTVIGGAAGGLGGSMVSDIGAAVSGLGTGATLYAISKLTEPGSSQAEELKDALTRAGKSSALLEQDKGVWDASQQWVKSFFQSDLSNMVDNARDAKFFIDQRVNRAQISKERFYEMLNLKPDARLVEVEAALKRRQVLLEKGPFIARWLAQRRLNSAYRFMLETNRQAVWEHLAYNTMLANINLKVIATIAEKNTGLIAQTLDGFTGQLKALWSKLWSGKESIKPEELKKLSEEATQMFTGQVSDLRAFNDAIINNPDILKGASLFGDTTLLDSFKDTLDGRIGALTNSYHESIDVILKEMGYGSLNA